MTMILHRGAVQVSRDTLLRVTPPERQGIYVPMPHHELADAVQQYLAEGNFEVTGEKHALSKNGKKYFGYFELSDQGGYSAVVGFRNSHDQSIAVSAALGSRVFICDNLALSGDIALFRKHTTNLYAELADKMRAAIAMLPAAIAAQNKDFNTWKERGISLAQTDYSIGQLYRNGVLNRSQLGDVFDEFRHQSEDHGPRTLWRLFNAVTHVMKSDTETGQIVTLPNRTKKLHAQLNVIEGEFREVA
jgi:hypothetical protein